MSTTLLRNGAIAGGPTSQQTGEGRAPTRAAPGRVLAVDLDNTLIRGDMLFETFWLAASRDWKLPFRALFALLRGRASLKRLLAEEARWEPASLRFEEEVLRRVAEWNRAGGRTALVSASDETVVRRIADHVGLFDDVAGSDGRRNLKGSGKASLLRDRYRGEDVVYVGDSRADLAVWETCAGAITVNASPGLRRRVDALHGDAEHVGRARPERRALLRAMRPHQWVKNVLIFLPLLLAHSLDPGSIGRAALAFVVFSLFASSAYLLNDLLDLSADRAHPRKRERPLASGALSLAGGTVLVPVLLVSALLGAALLGPLFLAVVVLYYATTLAYSLQLKRRPVIDICTLAGLYTLRIVAGAVAVGVPLSVWLLAFSIFFFLSLAAVKRQAELVDMSAREQASAHGRGYRVGDLPLIASMAIASGYVSVLVLALYLNSDPAMQHYGRVELLWGICAVLLYWINRMVMITHRGGMHDDPIVFALKDPTSRWCLLLVVGFALAGALW